MPEAAPATTELPAAAPGTPDWYRAWVGRTKDLVDAGLAGETLAACQEAEPHCRTPGWLSALHFFRGEAYRQLGRLEEAEERFRYVAGRFPDRQSTWYRRARMNLFTLRWQRKEYDEALREGEALAADFENYKDVKTETLHQLGLILVELERFEEAEKLFGRVLATVDSDSSLVDDCRAHLEHIDKQRASRAATDYERKAVSEHWGSVAELARRSLLEGAAESAGRSAVNLFYLGQACRQLGQLEEGRRYLQRVVDRFPDPENHWYQRARIGLAAMDWAAKPLERALAEADALFEELKIYPQLTIELHYELGLFHSAGGRYARAAEHFEFVRHTVPPASRLAGDCLKQQQHMERARESRVAAELEALAQEEKWKELVELGEKRKEASKDSRRSFAVCLYYVGQAWLRLGDLTRAAAFFQEAVGQPGAEPAWTLRARARLARVKRLRGELDAAEREAAELLQETEGKLPIDAFADLNMDLARMALRRGRPAEAAARFRAVIERCPESMPQRGQAAEGLAKAGEERP
jgi:tetratricopeptide (TPR) repeat protein